MTEADVVDRPDRWRLLDEREFLQRSLDDAAREHAAGDLADDDYELLRRRDEERLAVVEKAIAADERSARVASLPARDGLGASAASDEHAGDGPESPEAATGHERPKTASAGGRLAVRRRARGLNGGAPRRDRRRRWLAIGGAALLVAGGVLLAVELAAPRLPGDTATGSIDLTLAQEEQRQLTQAQDLLKDNHPTKALDVYGAVLSEDPKNPVALAEWGWLEWQAATQQKQSTAAVDAEGAVKRAVKLDAGLYEAQYYLGTILLEDGHPATAVTHFNTFLSDGPTSSWLEDAVPTIRKAFAAAGQPVPAGVPATPSSGS